MIQITPENEALEKPFSYINFILVPLKKLGMLERGNQKSSIVLFLTRVMNVDICPLLSRKEKCVVRKLKSH